MFFHMDAATILSSASLTSFFFDKSFLHLPSAANAGTLLPLTFFIVIDSFVVPIGSFLPAGAGIIAPNSLALSALSAPDGFGTTVKFSSYLLYLALTGSRLLPSLPALAKLPSPFFLASYMPHSFNPCTEHFLPFGV